MKVQLLWMMSARFRVSVSSLLLELASCDVRAPVPSVDVGWDGDDFPISSEKAAVVDFVREEKDVDLVANYFLNTFQV